MLSRPSTRLMVVLTGLPGSGGAVDRYTAPVGVPYSAVCVPSELLLLVVTDQPGASLV